MSPGVDAEASSPTLPRLVRLAVWFVLGLVVLGLGFWAGREVSRPGAEPEREIAQTMVVEVGEIHQVQRFAAIAEWPSVASVPLLDTGILTSLEIDDASPVGVGQALFSVELRPAFAAVGSVPAFRTLTQGDRGPDVLQLEQMLQELGHLDEAPDSEYSYRTTAAVRDWERTTGQAVDGVVAAGTVYYFPQLPARLKVEGSPAPGASVQERVTMIQALSEAPTFQIQLDPSQRNLVPVDAEVAVRSGELEWAGRVGMASERDGALVLEVVGLDGGALCGDECHAIATESPTDLPAEVTITPRSEGVMVPTSAIGVSSGGSTFVVAGDGSEMEIQIRASADGMAIVDGLEPGRSIRLDPAT